MMDFFLLVNRSVVHQGREQQKPSAPGKTAARTSAVTGRSVSSAAHRTADTTRAATAALTSTRPSAGGRGGSSGCGRAAYGDAGGPPTLATGGRLAARGGPRPDPAERVVDEILRAQEGQEQRVPYRQALREIRQGKKRSHWIWYVIPAMRAVRETSQPQFCLPSFGAARRYLEHPVLAFRLREITAAATAHLFAAPPAKRPARLRALFGGIDAQKFKETMTCFALAARESGDKEQLVVFLDGLRGAVGDDGPLDPATLQAIRDELGGGSSAFEGLFSVGDLLRREEAVEEKASRFAVAGHQGELQQLVGGAPSEEQQDERAGEDDDQLVSQRLRAGL